MASHAGKEGKITVKASGGSATNVVGLRSWTLNETSEVLDATVMNPAGVTYRTSVASFRAWEGSASLLWDDAPEGSPSNGQVLCVPGDTVELVVYPEGAATGDTTYTGNAIITAVNKTASYDGLVEMEVTFSGTGALTAAQAS